MRLNQTSKFISYLKENSVSVYYKDPSVNVVSMNHTKRTNTDVLKFEVLFIFKFPTHKVTNRLKRGCASGLETQK
jgi:EAL domain-containing protein (putative c-di-GMP-specific phosphodiesterase class I)